MDDAVAALKSGVYDVIVSDVKLNPGTSFSYLHSEGGHKTGLAFAQLARSLNPKIDVVLYSGFPAEDVRQWCSEMNCSFYSRSAIESDGVFTTRIRDISLQSPASRIFRLEAVFSRFMHAANCLQHRHQDRQAFALSDEYDVQDLLHALLLTHFNDIRREDSVPSVVGRNARVDLLIPEVRAIVEVKYSRPATSLSKLFDELAVDITRYQALRDFDILAFFIYDPTRTIRNPDGLSRDFAKLAPQRMTIILQVVT